MAIDASKQGQEAAAERADAYQDDADQKKHMALIHEIAEEQHVSLDHVAACYESTLREMRSSALVHDFLDIFVTKRVRERYRNRPH